MERLTLSNVFQNPGHLKRKRQKTDGDPVHFLIQQQNQHQNDGQDGRQANVNSWNAANLPAIKTEPRDTSPQPFGIHRVPPQLTPSPQPLSPPCSYTQSTPSPYNIAPAVTLGTQGNQRLISPNQQYNANSTVGGCNNRPLIDITEYNSFGQQTQPQQHQYHGSNMGAAGAAAPHWGSKCNTAIPAGGNLINLNNTNSFAMNNILTSSNPAETPGPNNAGWNLATNHFPPHQLHQQYQQHPTQGVSANNNGILSNAAVAAHNANNANMNEHGFSNLLTFDSEQYVRINTEDQQMLRLDTEDLQISNLSITT